MVLFSLLAQQSEAGALAVELTEDADQTLEGPPRRSRETITSASQWRDPAEYLHQLGHFELRAAGPLEEAPSAGGQLPLEVLLAIGDRAVTVCAPLIDRKARWGWACDQADDARANIGASLWG